MKVKYKGQEMEIPEGATFKVVGGNLVISPEYTEFKDGDICYCKNAYGDFIFIFNRFDGAFIKETYYYFGLFDDLSRLYNSKFKDTWDMRIATEEEKQKLFDSLEKDGKKWNPETKQIEDILKVGDLCIFWDDEKSEACVNYLVDIDISNTDYLDCDFSGYKNAIKCTSLEQYINFKK